MNKPYIIKLSNAAGTVQTVELEPGRQQAAVVEVGGQVKVELVNPATSRAPQTVAVRRVGKDLQIAFEGGNPDQPDLVLQGFYEKDDKHLVGLAEDGSLFEYAPTSGDSDAYLPMLPDGSDSIQALGFAVPDAAVQAAGAEAFSPWVLGAIGLGLLTVVAVSADGKSRGGGVATGDGGGVAILLTPTQKPSGYLDNVGSIQNPNSNAPVTDDNTPGLRIGALPTGATGAVLYVDGVVTPATYDPATGTLTPVTPLTDGKHTLGYGLTNPGGTTPSSPTLEVTIDTVPPTAPVLHVVDADGDGRPDITGTGEPGGLVIITDPTGATHTTTVQPDGSFALEIDRPTTPTGDWRATVTDPAGNISPPGRVTVTDLTAPTAPTIDGVLDNVGAVTGLVPNNGATDDTTPTYTGTAEPGSKVTLFDALNRPIGTVTADSITGLWSLTPTTALPDGTYTVTARASDAAGNTSLTSAPFVFTVDTVAPAATTITSLLDDVGPIQGQIVNGTVTDDTRPTMSGRAEPDSTITIKDGTLVLGTTSAGTSGYWSFTPTTDLAQGAHSWSATVSDRAGNSSPATTPISFVVDTTPPAQATITSVFDDQGSSTGNLVSAVATVTDDAQPLIRGTAEANSTVIIKDGTVQIGTAPVDGTGAWFFTPTTPLLNGVHHITAAAVDAAGNVGLASSVFDFTLVAGGIAPAPAITNVIDDVGTVANIAPNGLTNDPTPTVRGTAHAGHTVRLYSEAGALLGTYLVLADGQWSITVPALADGAHSFTATATDPANNVSLPTQPYQIVVDTTAPGPATALTLTDNVNPQTGLITTGSVTDDATPTFEGTAEPGATVLIKDGVATLGTAQVNELGRWTFTPTTPLVDGPHSLTATVTDPAGNVSQPTTPVSFIVDTTAVLVAIDSVSDDVGSSVGFLSPGALTDDLRPTVSGHGTPGGVVKLYVDGLSIPGATTTAGPDGRWAITPGTDLSQGTHLLTVTVTTSATGESRPTAAFTLTIDSVAPDVPVLVSVEDNVGPSRGPVPAGSPSDDSTPTLKGTAEPLSKVTILDAGQAIGTTTADKLGNWTFTPATPLNDGTHAITLTSTDAAGNVSVPSLAWNVVIDTAAPTAAPVITSVFDDQGSSTGNLVSGITTVTDDASPLISGTSEPNGSVIIKDGTVTIGTAAVNGLGIWTFTPVTPLFNGVHHITATAVDASGNVGQTSTSFDFTLITGGIPTAPAITNVIDDVGTIENIAPNGLTNDPTPTVKGTAHAGHTVSLYSETGTLIGTYLVLADGQWSITVPTLADGAHSFTATATDLASNVSLPTQPYQIVVDTLAPGPATATTLTDNVNPKTGLITTGTVTDDATPTFEGTAEVGATVLVKDGVTALGTAQVSELGRWTFTPTTPLPDGAHSFTATVTDKAGNVSPPTTPINFTVDTTVALVAIDSVFDDVNAITGNLALGDSTNDRRPTINGTATPGGTVKLYVDGVAIPGATATVGSDGQWHITPGTDLSQGLHLLTATVTTAAAGESLPTGPFTLTIDSVAPDAPALVSVTDNVDAIRGPVAAGAPTNDSTPLLKGTAEPLSKVTILDGGQAIGTTTADKLGNWTFTPASPLNDGAHAITLTATDAAGNVSLPSLPWSVVVDTTGPTTAPTITSVFDDQGTSTGNLVSGVATVTDDASPLVTGTSEPNGSVIIKDGTVQIGTAAVNAAGVWTFLPTTPLLNGIHHITATAVDASGNAGQTSIPFDFKLVAGGVPAAPAITNVIDDVGTIENIAPNGLTNDPTPTVRGTARAGHVVMLYNEANALLGTYLVSADGQWSITVPTLADGAHSFTATATDPALNVSLPTQPYPIVVDTVAPGPATATTLTDNVNPQTGLITTGSVTDDATPTFEGTAEVGATVLVKDGVTPLGTAQVNELGRWTFTPTTPLPDGAHSFTATVTDKAGNASTITTPINFIVDTSHVLISIDSVFDDIDPVTGNLVDNTSTNDRRPTVSGTATPGGIVKLYVDGVAVAGATATVGSDGQWHITPGADLAQGQHLLTATVTTVAAGESSRTAPFTLVVDSVLPDAPVLVSVTDNVDPLRGLVAAGAASDDSTPTLKGTAEADSKVTILDGGQPIGTTTADHLGNWTFTPASPLNDGTHAITLTATDAAGNVSLPSTPWSLLVDTAPPATPLITASADNVAPNTGDIASGVATNDPTPLMSGTADANVLISLYDGNVLMGTTTASGLGIWSFTPTLVGDRVHAITITATNAAGNVSSPSAVWNVNLDTSAPTVRTITASNDNVALYIGDIASGIATNDPTPLVSGTAEADSLVSLYDGTVLLGTTTASALGIWSFTPTLVGDRVHAITITSTDAAGNVSSPSAVWNVNLDTSVPTVRTITASNDNVAPHTGDIASGTATNDPTPLMSGTAEADSLVSLYDGTVLLGTTTASGLGIWSFTPTLVGDRVHAITITSTNAAGNVSSPSAVWNVNLDTSAPTVRTITVSNDNVALYTGDIASGTATNDPTPLMSGTAEADSLVSLYDGTVLLGTTTASGLGTWSFTPTLVGDRIHAITITSTDAAGNVSSPSAVWNVNLDTTVPTVRTITASNDNVALYTGDIANGTATNDATPLMSGTAEADSLVRLYDGTVLLATTTASGLGTWSFTPTLVGDRVHAITITSTDAAGNVSSPSAIWNVNLDTSAPTVRSITASNDNVALYTGDIASGTATNDPTPLISGTAEADSLVSVYDGNVLLGTTTASGLGTWSFTPTLTGDGSHAITITATDTAGNVSQRSAIWTVLLDTTPPGVPDITSSNDDVELYTGDIPSGTLTNDSRPYMTGTAELGSTVSLYDDGVLVGTTVVTVSGNWHFDPALVGDGTHAITVTATDAAGNTSLLSTVWNVALDATAPIFTTNGATSANENTASGTVIYSPAATDAHAITYSISGGADASLFTINSTTGEVKIIFSPDYEKPLDAGGNNIYDYIVTATDAAGNYSSQNAAFTVKDVQERFNLIRGGDIGDANDWEVHLRDAWAGEGRYGNTNSNLSSSPFSPDGNRAGLLFQETDQASGITFVTASPFELKAGVTYTFAFDLQVGYAQANGRFGFELLNSSNNVASDLYWSANTRDYPDKGWRTIEMTFSVGTSGSYKLASFFETFTYRPPTTFTDDIYLDRIFLGIPPVVLDLNRDGHLSYSSTAVDVNGDGRSHTSAWVGPEDGVLVWDKYHDGRVHDGSQYAFAQYLSGAKTDLEGLKIFDTNGNYKLDSGDAIWAEMNVWQDLNNNGVSDVGEVKTLAQWGIAAIDLTSDGVASSPTRNIRESGKSSATLEDGTQMVLSDVSFGINGSMDGNVVAHPFVLDLNHDGTISYGKELMDVSGAGARELTAWAGRQDGVLVWDKYHDAQLHDSSQYSFGALTGAGAAAQGLKIFDTNADGRLDSHDLLWNELGVWQIGADGVGAMKTLAQLDIESISLGSDGKAGAPADGVTEAGRTTATLTNGGSMVVADAAFSHVAVDSPPVVPSYLDQTQQHLVI